MKFLLLIYYSSQYAIKHMSKNLLKKKSYLDSKTTRHLEKYPHPINKLLNHSCQRQHSHFLNANPLELTYRTFCLLHCTAIIWWLQKPKWHSIRTHISYIWFINRTAIIRLQNQNGIPLELIYCTFGLLHFSLCDHQVAASDFRENRDFN